MIFGRGTEKLFVMQLDFFWSCVNCIRSRKMLKKASLDLFISKFSGGGMPQTPLPCRLEPPATNFISQQLEILVTALY